jgi:hypothetical protein
LQVHVDHLRLLGSGKVHWHAAAVPTRSTDTKEEPEAEARPRRHGSLASRQGTVTRITFAAADGGSQASLWRRPNVLVPGQMVDQWGHDPNVNFKFTSKLLQLRVLVGLE